MKITFLYGLTLCSACLFLGSFLSTHFFLLSGINIPMEFKISIQVALCVILFFIALVNTETMYGKKLIRAM